MISITYERLKENGWKTSDNPGTYRRTWRKIISDFWRKEAQPPASASFHPHFGLEPSIHPCCPCLYKYIGLSATRAGNCSSWARISNSSTSTSCSWVISRDILLSITHPWSGLHRPALHPESWGSGSNICFLGISTLVHDPWGEVEKRTVMPNKERELFLPRTPYISGSILLTLGRREEIPILQGKETEVEKFYRVHLVSGEAEFQT